MSQFSTDQLSQTKNEVIRNSLLLLYLFDVFPMMQQTSICTLYTLNKE